MLISIIIINHGTKKLTLNCVNSIFSTVKSPFEVIIVDNTESEKGRLLRSDVPLCKLIYSKNLGFSSGCNLGAEQAKGDVLLFLNSDTVVLAECIDLTAKRLMRDDSLFAVGARGKLPDGSLDKGCKRGLPTPLNSLCYFLKLDTVFQNCPVCEGYHMTYLPERKAAFVEAISGAYFMIKQDKFRSLGGFREEYFLYGEDVDLCFRIKQNGGKILYCPKAQYIHFKGKSGVKKGNKRAICEFYRSMLIYYRLNLIDKYPRLVSNLVSVSILAMLILRLSLLCIHERQKSERICCVKYDKC